MLRVSRVPEHLDTRSIADPKPELTHDIVILVKRRPSGKSNNRHTVGPMSHTELRSRDPVSLGDVDRKSVV